MKSKLMLVTFVVCFSLFLFLGIKASQALFADGDHPTRVNQSTKGPVLLEEQVNEPTLTDPFTLLIYVDDLLRPDPLLQGVWLTRSGEGQGIKLFFPIFPSQAEDGLQRDLNLRGAFWLEDSTLPSNQFLTILADRNLSWDHLFILDESAMMEIGFLLHETNPEYFLFNSDAISSLVYQADSRDVIRENQALLIQELCGQLPLPGQNEVLQRFLEGFSGHIHLNGVTPLEFTQAWGGGISCLFPTLTLPGE
jgi:hypothetical protein